MNIRQPILKYRKPIVTVVAVLLTSGSLAQNLFKNRAYVPEDVTSTTLIFEIIPRNTSNSGDKLTNTKKYEKFLAKYRLVVSEYRHKYVLATKEEIQSDSTYLDNITYKYVLSTEMSWMTTTSGSSAPPGMGGGGFVTSAPVGYGIRFEEIFIDDPGVLRRSSYGIIAIESNLSGKFHHLKKMIKILNSRD